LLQVKVRGQRAELNEVEHDSRLIFPKRGTSCG
jgi:hypothetical protein